MTIEEKQMFEKITYGHCSEDCHNCVVGSLGCADKARLLLQIEKMKCFGNCFANDPKCEYEPELGRVCPCEKWEAEK